MPTIKVLLLPDRLESAEVGKYYNAWIIGEDGYPVRVFNVMPQLREIEHNTMLHELARMVQEERDGNH